MSSICESAVHRQLDNHQFTVSFIIIDAVVAEMADPTSRVQQEDGLTPRSQLRRPPHPLPWTGSLGDLAFLSERLPRNACRRIRWHTRVCCPPSTL